MIKVIASGVVPERAAGAWRTSSLCASNTCVAVKIDGAAVHVRDSKQPGGAVLTFTPQEWRDFVAGVRLGEFDMEPGGETSG